MMCPKCKHSLRFVDESTGACANGHEFPVNSRVLDLLPNITDKHLQNEAQHFDQIFEEGTRKFKIDQDPYIGNRLLEKSRRIYHRILSREYESKHVKIGEIGCGDASAYWYLTNIPFASVKYIGSDISLKSLEYAAAKKEPPDWNSIFIRSSANDQLFCDESLDMVLSAGALHHFQVERVFSWVSKALKLGGVFIIHEPSDMNPFAYLGRRFVKGFHTEGERPLKPSLIKKLAHSRNLNLEFERGINFVSGPLAYLFGMVRIPKPLKIISYHGSNALDEMIRNPSISYGFIHIYKKTK